MSEFTIRGAGSEDRDAWLQMRQALWPECPHDQHLAEVAEIVLADNEIAFIAVSQSGEQIGFVEASIRPWVEWCDTKSVGFVEGWFVKADRRRRGVGKALVAVAEEWASAKGCLEMASDAHLSNTVSQQAHQALGFERCEAVVRFRKRL